MKSKLLAIGLAIIALPALAQDHADSYNRSAFAKFNSIQSSYNREQSLVLQHKIRQHFPGWKISLDKLSGNFRDIYGDGLAVPGTSMADKAAYCFDNYLSDVSVDRNEWQLVRNNASPKAAYMGYVQSFGGHKVIFSSLSFRFTLDGRLQRITNKSFGAPAPSALSPVISREDAAIAAAQDITDATVTGREVENDWVWFPLPASQGYILHPSWPFTVTGTTKTGLPLILKGYVDGITGEVVYRANRVKETVDRIVKGEVYKQNPTLPATLEPLDNLQIDINGASYFTDTAGFISAPSLTLPVVSTVSLQGPWSTVTAQLAGGIIPAALDTITANGGLFIYPTITPIENRHVNAYYHVNRVHEFMKGFFPSFTGMDYSLPTNVDVSGSCNAFYNGSSINFLTAGNGCVSFATCGDIVYHEYGHGISDLFYDSQGAGTIFNGALNEGNSDIWGISITHNPILGQGSSSNGGFIRRYDLAPKVYPVDIEGEVHADGEIIAGAWWDVAVNISSPDTMTQLFTQTYYDTPDGPDGSEGQIYHDVLVSALMADDNDASLSNGTPHFSQIITAFARHGIYLLGDATLNHAEVKNAPANTPVTIDASLVLNNADYFQKLSLVYRKRPSATWDTMVLTNTSGLNFTGTIPGQPAGSLVDYYFVVYDFLSIPNIYFPLGYYPTQSSLQSTISYQFGVGLEARDSIQFETPATGWTIGNVSGDAASVSGIWIQAKPVGSYLSTATGSINCQTNADHTFADGTGQCLVTGNALSTSLGIGTADVDNGATTVLSPVFDLTGFTEPVVEYYRWYSNDLGGNPGNDAWVVSIRSSTSTFWNPVERTFKSDRNWRRRIFGVDQYLPGVTKFQLKFVASDQTGFSMSSVVEAAVDDLFIYDKQSTSGVGNSPSVAKAKIYPNPAGNMIRVEVAQAVEGRISLHDITGKQVMETSMTQGTSVYTLNTSNVASGTYMIVISSPGSIQTHKITVAHQD